MRKGKTKPLKHFAAPNRLKAGSASRFGFAKRGSTTHDEHIDFGNKGTNNYDKK